MQGTAPPPVDPDLNNVWLSCRNSGGISNRDRACPPPCAKLKTACGVDPGDGVIVVIGNRTAPGVAAVWSVIMTRIAGGACFLTVCGAPPHFSQDDVRCAPGVN